MKKITSKNLTKRIAQYGAMSLAIAGVSDAMGQVVYTDIDPDLTIDDTFFDVDFNNDGTIDYTIHNDGGGGFAVRIYNDESNSVMGANFGGQFNYPYVLNLDDPIGSTGNFTAHSVYQTLNWVGCSYTNSNWCGGQIDKYLGLRFNIGADQHYGWIQLDVPADGSSFTIKGFAYESTPDGEILAGDIGLIGVEDQSFNDFAYFVDNNELKLSASTPMNSVVLHSITGQQVQSQSLSTTNESVNIAALSSGIYLATVTIENASKTIKFVKR